MRYRERKAKKIQEIGYREGSKFWQDVAKRLAKSRKNLAEVNLASIERNTEPKEIIVVPGKVLGYGELSKKLKIAALSFSSAAQKKIGQAGGKCLSLEELAESNPKGSGLKILG